MKVPDQSYVRKDLSVDVVLSTIIFFLQAWPHTPPVSIMRPPCVVRLRHVSIAHPKHFCLVNIRLQSCIWTILLYSHKAQRIVETMHPSVNIAESTRRW